MLHVFSISLQVLYAVNEFNGFFLKTSFKDAKEKYVSVIVLFFKHYAFNWLPKLQSLGPRMPQDYRGFVVEKGSWILGNPVA